MMFCFFSAMVEQPSTDRNLLEALSYLHFRYVKLKFFVKAHLGKYPMEFVFLSLSLRSLWWIILVLASLPLAKVEPFLVGVKRTNTFGRSSIFSFIIRLIFGEVRFYWSALQVLSRTLYFTHSPAAFGENMMWFKCLLEKSHFGREFLYRVFFWWPGWMLVITK